MKGMGSGKSGLSVLAPFPHQGLFNLIVQADLAKVAGSDLVGKSISNPLQRIAAVDDGAPAEVFQRTYHVLLLAATDDQATQGLLLAHQLQGWNAAGNVGEHADQRDVAARRLWTGATRPGRPLRPLCRHHAPLWRPARCRPILVGLCS